MRDARLCLWILPLAAMALVGCASSSPTSAKAEATSLLGRPLSAPQFSPEQRKILGANLAAAQAAFNEDPSEDNIIWLGRRLAYLGRYNEAIATFSRGLDKFPHSPKLLRHRGHRYITVRQFDKAIADLTLANAMVAGRPDEVEPDGSPNAKNVPRSTLHSNIRYHLALAYYLKGDFAGASSAWFYSLIGPRRPNDDQIVSSSYWLYLARKRSGDHAGAIAALRDIRPDMDVIENQSYHRLCLCFKGELKPEEVGEGKDAPSEVGIAYGLAVRKVLLGDKAGAKADFERIIAGENWAAFGYIAAEAELARERGR